MELEQNLDAYRVVAELLARFRDLLLEDLKARHGEDWHRVPAFHPVVDRLVARKEREKAIDWYNSEYQELIHYASFEDLLELLEADPQLATVLRRLVTAPALLHARLLELEALREKLAMARAITDSELGFLITFHQRFLDLVERDEARIEPSPGEATQAPAATPTEQVTEGETPGEPAPARAPADRGPRATSGSTSTTDPGTGRKRIRVRAPRPATPNTSPATATATEAPPSPRSLAEALEERDDRTVLRELYREVTGIADDLFTAETLPHPAVWVVVREHPWYRERIGALGLRPLSDFYQLVERVAALRADGASDRDVQEFLKEKNFAKLLLELRDMFQRNRV